MEQRAILGGRGASFSLEGRRKGIKMIITKFL